MVMLCVSIYHKWNTNEWDTDKILDINDQADIGYLFSVDLDIPYELHDHFNNYAKISYFLLILDRIDSLVTSGREQLCLSLHGMYVYKNL
jgi:hypothetical protein